MSLLMDSALAGATVVMVGGFVLRLLRAFGVGTYAAVTVAVTVQGVILFGWLQDLLNSTPLSRYLSQVAVGLTVGSWVAYRAVLPPKERRARLM